MSGEGGGEVGGLGRRQPPELKEVMAVKAVDLVLGFAKVEDGGQLGI